MRQYEYVDLGLPSGLKWAKCNLGAENETDFGDYFMWGSTTPNNDTPCDWEHAPFNNGLSDYDETYFNSVKDTVCPNGILAKGYDAASQIMGGDWRMPTKDEVQELVGNTDREWVEDFNGSGMNGRKFTASNGNTIFIPASGFRSGTSFDYQGSLGSIWTSSLLTMVPYVASCLYFYSDYVVRAGKNYYSYCGFSVRGVMD